MKDWHWHIRLYNIRNRDESFSFNGSTDGYDTLLKAAISAYLYLRNYIKTLRR